MQFRIFVFAGVFFEPRQVEGEVCLSDIFPKYVIFINKSVPGNDNLYPFSISEKTSGALICTASNRELCLSTARLRLQDLTESQFAEHLQKMQDILKANRAMYNDPLWSALDSAGYMCTEQQLVDFKVSLLKSGYELKKIDNDSPRN